MYAALELTSDLNFLDEQSDMIYDPDIETRPLEVQYELDKTSYRDQIAYLFEHSPFYREKLQAAGFGSAADVGGLEDIAALPFTEKDELRTAQASTPPFGSHLACDTDKLVRVFISSLSHLLYRHMLMKVMVIKFSMKFIFISKKMQC